MRKHNHSDQVKSLKIQKNTHMIGDVNPGDPQQKVVLQLIVVVLVDVVVVDDIDAVLELALLTRAHLIVDIQIHGMGILIGVVLAIRGALAVHLSEVVGTRADV
jgi:hypothetical protein